MRLRPVILFAAVMLALAGTAFSQSVIVTPKKTTYRRRKPIADFKKTFVVVYPKVNAGSPAVSRKIEAALSYEKAFDFTMAEEMGETQWLEEASFEVKYNANGLLCAALSITGTGAYPSSSTRYVVVDTSSGNAVRPADAFTNTTALVSRLKKIQAAEVKEAKREIRKDPDARDQADMFFNDTKFTAANLKDFGVSKAGVTFFYDYGFPHVALALQPDGEYFLSWADMKPFVKPGGLLAKMVR